MKLKIGKLKLDSKFIAAPLAGFTDVAWRVIARRLGAGLVFSEMVSAEGLLRGHENTIDYLRNDGEARPFALQLFGTNPNSFARAVRYLPVESFDVLDINMGCPVKKVVKRGAGSALMKSPELIGQIVGAVRKEYRGPLTVKIRSGWDEKTINAVEVAKIIEGEGADCVIVHPRTGRQVFHGTADWSVIRDVKQAVKIPVVGNGDVVDVESCKRMFAETGCDGVMIGRASLGNPWIFREVVGEPPATLTEKFALIREHAELLRKFEDERQALIMIRKFFSRYLKGKKGVREVTAELYQLKTLDEILDRLELFKRTQYPGY